MRQGVRRGGMNGWEKGEVGCEEELTGLSSLEALPVRRSILRRGLRCRARCHP